MDKNYTIGENCEIASTAIIEEGCVIGNNVKIHHYAVLYPGTVIGDNCEIFEHTVIGRPPKAAGILVSKVGKDLPPVTIGDGTVVGASTVIYADCHIGANVMVGDLVMFRECCYVGDNCVLGTCTNFNHHVTIGKNVKIVNFSHITSRSVVEDEVFVGVGVVSVNDRRMKQDRELVDSRIILRKGCKIGSGAVLFPSVKVGENAFVGANSVVSRDVERDTVVMGSPAKEKRKNENA